MRYLYHLTEGNRGPVTFEQLQELAKAGTIDNMTPVLAEGAREWSRWLFIKDTPPAAAPAPQVPAPAPAPVTTPAPKPALQKKEAPKPVAKLEPAPVPTPQPTPQPAPAQKTEAKPSALEKAPAPKQEKPAHAHTAAAPAPEEKAPAPAPAAETLPAEETPDKPFSLREFGAELNLIKLIPTGVCAVITLLSLLAAFFWSVQAHDAEEEYTTLRDMVIAQEQNRAESDKLAVSQQQVQAETLKLEDDMLKLQEKLKLTKEESERLAKGPYISEAEAKQLKDEQARAARLKEQEQKL